MAHRAPLALSFIGSVLLLIAGIMGLNLRSKMQLGQALLDDSERTGSTIQSVERLGPLRCALHLLRLCEEDESLLAQVTFTVDDQVIETQMYFAAGDSDNIEDYLTARPLTVYLVSDPHIVERAPDFRIAKAVRSRPQVYVVAGLAVAFLLLAGLVAGISRKRGPRS